MKSAGLFLLAAAMLPGAIRRTPSADDGLTCASKPCTLAVTCASSSCASNEIQAALNEAELGDTITLEAGKAWTVGSPLTIYRKNSGTGYLTIRTSADDRLPAGDTRITPVYLPLLPELRLTTNNILLQVEQSSNAVEHYRFMGVWFSVATGVERTNDLIRLWDDVHHTDPSFVPNDIIFDRCIFLPSALSTARIAVRMGVRNGQILNSFFDHLKTQADSQAVSFINTPGPVVMRNNYVSAPGENIIVGGAVPTIPNLAPLDLDFYQNTFQKDPALLRYENWSPGLWVRKGKIINGGNGYNYIAIESGVTGEESPVLPAALCQSPPVCAGGCCVADGTVTWQRNWFGSSEKWTVKNLFEFKYMGRSKVLWNTFDGSWSDGQSGYALSFKPESQCNRCWVPRTENLEVAYNVIQSVERPFLFGGSGDDGGGVAQNWSIHDNLVWRNATAANPAIGHYGADAVTLTHNTIDANNTTAIISTSDATAEVFTATDNLLQKSLAGIKRGGSAEGTASLAAAFKTYTFLRNVVAGIKPASYPAGNYSTAWGSIGFTDATRGEYRLRNSSLYRRSGTDGRDLGADMSQLPLIRNLRVAASSRAALLSWQVTAPIQDIPCVIEASANRDFSNYVSDLDPLRYTRPDTTGHDRLPQQRMSRIFVLGANSSLAPRTTYWYRLHCGGAMAQGSFTTGEARTELQTVRVRKRQTTAGAVRTVVEWGTSYSRATDTIGGGGEEEMPCATGEVCAADFTVEAGIPVYYRIKDVDAAGSVLRAGRVAVRPL